MRNVLFTLAVFSMIAFPGLSHAENELEIRVSIEKCLLTVWQKTPDGTPQLIEEFPVGTPKKGLKKFPLGNGYATQVIMNPVWYPTKSVVDYLNKTSIKQGKKPIYRYGEGIRHDDPRNMIGNFKVILTHHVPGKGSIYRIHGTNRPELIGKRVSGGCIRMKNGDGKKLAKIIDPQLKKGSKIPVIITM